MLSAMIYNACEGYDVSTYWGRVISHNIHIMTSDFVPQQ